MTSLSTRAVTIDKVQLNNYGNSSISSSESEIKNLSMTTFESIVEIEPQDDETAVDVIWRLPTREKILRSSSRSESPRMEDDQMIDGEEHETSDFSSDASIHSSFAVENETGILKRSRFAADEEDGKQKVISECPGKTPARPKIRRAGTPANLRKRSSISIRRASAGIPSSFYNESHFHQGWTCLGWLTSVFSTRREQPRLVVTSDDVELAEQTQEFREYVASQLISLPAGKREIIKTHGLQGIGQVFKNRLGYGDQKSGSRGARSFSLASFPSGFISQQKQQNAFPRFEHWTCASNLDEVSGESRAVLSNNILGSECCGTGGQTPSLTRIPPSFSRGSIAVNTSSCSSSTAIDRFLKPLTPPTNPFDRDNSARWDNSGMFVVSATAGMMGIPNVAR